MKILVLSLWALSAPCRRSLTQAASETAGSAMKGAMVSATNATTEIACSLHQPRYLALAYRPPWRSAACC